MIMKRWIFLIILPLLALQSAAAQDSGDALRKGQLENGLTYYVKQTKLNAGRAEFYLIQNVGALMEQDNQNGLAHVLEHMAFNGTENFPKGVQTFLRRNGVSSLMPTRVRTRQCTTSTKYRPQRENLWTR